MLTTKISTINALGLLQYLNRYSTHTYRSWCVIYPKLNTYIVTNMTFNHIHDSDIETYHKLPVGDNKNLALYYLA